MAAAMPRTVRGRDLSTRKAPSSRSDNVMGASGTGRRGGGTWRRRASPGPTGVGPRDAGPLERSGGARWNWLGRGPGVEGAAGPPGTGPPAGGRSSGSTADRLSPWTTFGPASYGDAFADVYDRWYPDVTDVDACVARLAELARRPGPPAAARSSSWGWAPVAWPCRWRRGAWP